MNWGNHGLYNGEFNYGWDLDHIIPISSATTKEEMIDLNHSIVTYSHYVVKLIEILREIIKQIIFLIIE